jgi:hypothetical protein
MDRKTVIEALPRLPVCSGRLLPHQSRSPRPRRDPRYKERLHGLFTGELEALEHPTPGRAADQILLLIDGVLVDAVTRPETHPAKAHANSPNAF